MNNNKKHFYIMRCLSIILAICIAITSIQLPVYADNAGSETVKSRDEMVVTSVVIVAALAVLVYIVFIRGKKK